ncbi:YopX family protein [Bacillus bingmayongensis]|uniref:YopX family protein n=1 Tax=Bacillus bingmayongensis TaxID=1150157 RepID=UPI0002E92FAB|nr:YopX family protein [Bacillus bingmayongensis]MBY0597714.1 YopX family protein [Bacillus bingmayongensis]
MSRFQFRTWDKTAKVMEQYLHLQLSPNGQLYHDGMNVTDNYEIMQCTGLKDSDGTEIYEGDIVKFSGYVNAIGIVKFNDKLGIYQAVNGESSWLCCKESGVEQRVIGNIYDNIDLVQRGMSDGQAKTD